MLLQNAVVDHDHEPKLNLKPFPPLLPASSKVDLDTLDFFFTNFDVCNGASSFPDDEIEASSFNLDSSFAILVR